MRLARFLGWCARGQLGPRSSANHSLPKRVTSRSAHRRAIEGHMPGTVSRRDLLAQLGVTGAAALAGSAAGIGVAGIAHAQDKPKGAIPDKPFRIGHMTFFTGPGAVLGEPMYKGNLLAADEMKLLTISIDGSTDFLFDKAVPNPRYVFRVTNIQSADGSTCALAVAMTWPDVKKVAHIHPDYAYGRNAFDHFTIVCKKLLPGAQNVSEAWPKLFSTDFTSHITKTLAAKPDLLVTSVWGGDYVAFYKQALQHGLFDKMKVATTLALGVAPHAIGKDHPEGVLAGVHANYPFS